MAAAVKALSISVNAMFAILCCVIILYLDAVENRKVSYLSLFRPTLFSIGNSDAIFHTSLIMEVL
jgi:hypothetical protein